MKGTAINLHFLGIGNGLTVSKITMHSHTDACNRSDNICLAQDPLSQYPGYLSYAASNPYVRDHAAFLLIASILFLYALRYHPLVSSSIIQTATDAWNKSGGCSDLVCHASDDSR